MAAPGQRQALLDLAGDGHLDLVELGGPMPGFYERTDERGWRRSGRSGRTPTSPGTTRTCAWSISTATAWPMS